MPTTNGSYSWIVVSDPMPEGGFSPGVKFSEEEVVHMLRQKTFTMGTVLRHRTYGKFTVIPPNLNHSYRLRNSKYYGTVYGYKFRLIERDQQRRDEVA